MIKACLFFVLIASTLEVTIMAGQLSEPVTQESFLKLFERFSDRDQLSKYMKQNDFRGPIKEFVSRCLDLKLAERVSEYRARINAIEAKDPLYNINMKGGGALWLIQEIASQGDFESLELLEKDFPLGLKDAFWRGVAVNATDDAKKLLVKWAKENPTVPTLMPYHPNGVNLLIEMAEDKNATVGSRVRCLRLLGNKRLTNDDLDKIKETNALDKIKALMSKHMSFVNDGASDDKPPATLGSVAAETVQKLEAAIKLQEK
jgi:hypothetical protein